MGVYFTYAPLDFEIVVWALFPWLHVPHNSFHCRWANEGQNISHWRRCKCRTSCTGLKQQYSAIITSSKTSTQNAPLKFSAGWVVLVFMFWSWVTKIEKIWTWWKFSAVRTTSNWKLGLCVWLLLFLPSKHWYKGCPMDGLCMYVGMCIYVGTCTCR